MQTKPVVSTNKIIFLVVFVSAAIMASLFVFHLRNKIATPTLSPEQGMMFSVARDIKSFELVAQDGNPFTQNAFRDHWTLLFFGFTHCSSVCPTTLDMLSRAYPQLKAQYPNLQVVLVSLDPERDTLNALTKYTQTYNANFIGVSGKINELRKLQSQLGIFSAREDANNNYQIQHTASILLVNPKGQWAGLFKFGQSSEEFITAFKNGVRVS